MVCHSNQVYLGIINKVTMNEVSMDYNSNLIRSVFSWIIIESDIIQKKKYEKI